MRTSTTSWSKLHWHPELDRALPDGEWLEGPRGKDGQRIAGDIWRFHVDPLHGLWLQLAARINQHREFGPDGKRRFYEVSRKWGVCAVGLAATINPQHRHMQSHQRRSHGRVVGRKKLQP